MKQYLRFIDEIRANNFFFDSDGLLDRIIGTKYDFDGKATFISKISEEYGIPVQSILFVGNSMNDEYVYLSGARTLCINPKNTDSLDKVVWHNRINECNSLNQILEYIVE